MNRPVRHAAASALLFLAGFALGGCVTAHEAKAKIEILDNTTNRNIDDCILLTVRMESAEAQGHWWVAQEETSGHMIPTEARVRTINTGDVIDQKGKVMVTIGPYVKGHTLGVVYWLYRPGYQPDDFLSDHLERAYEDKTTLDIHLLPEDPGSSISDEKILDGARRVLEVQNYLEPCNPDVTRLLTLLIEQVQHVKEHAYKPKWQKHSREMLPKLREALQRFPRTEVMWKNLPDKPVNAPVEPPAAEAPVETPVKQPAAVPVEKPQPPTAAADLPAPSTQPAEETSTPELIPVDLSEIDTPPSETQPSGDTVQHDLTPIRKKP